MSRNTLPNLVIPGAGKSGTTFVADLLDSHPDIFMAVNKEPAFFSTFPGRGRFHEGWPEYKKNFAGVSGEKYVAEASSVYMYDVDSPRMIYDNLGDIRLIFVLRDPVERTYSNYWQDIKTGHDWPPFCEMVQNRHPRIEEMLWASKYGQHLERYYQYFSYNNVHIVFFDDLQSDLSRSLRGMLSFLGLPMLPEPISTMSLNRNEAAVPKWRLVSRALRSKYVTRPVRRVAPGWAQPLLRRSIKQLREWAVRSSEYPPMYDSTRRILLEELCPDIEAVEKITGRDLARWKSVPRSQ